MGSESPREGSRYSRFPTPRISLLIGITELRRGWRKLRQQDVWLALVGLGLLGILLVLPLVYDITRDVGSELAAGEADAVAPAATVVAGFWLFTVVIAVVTGIGSDGEIDNAAGVLTVRPPKDVAGGLLVNAAVWFAPFVLPAFVVGGVGLSAGVGSPFPVIGAVVAGVTLLVTAALVGYPIGLAAKGAIRRSKRLSDLKPVLGTVVVVGYAWLVFSGELNRLLDTAGEAIEATPVGWLADLALVTTPGAEASMVRALAVLAIAAVIIPASALATARAGAFTWYTDDARSADESEPADGTTAVERLDTLVGSLTRRDSTRGVAVMLLVRAYRAPLQLVFVALPLLLTLPIVESAVTTGTVPDYTIWMVVLYGAWAAGASFPLNVLGNQSATLPTLLLSRARGHEVVRGHVLAATLLLAPVTLLGAVGVGLIGNRSVPELLSIGAVAVATVVAGGIVASGLGALFPRFSSIDVTADRSASVPSKVAFSLFTLLVFLSVLATASVTDEIMRLLLSSLITDWAPFDITPGDLETLGQILLPGLVALVPVAYVIAIRRVDSYRLD